MKYVCLRMSRSGNFYANERFYDNLEAKVRDEMIAYVVKPSSDTPSVSGKLTFSLTKVKVKTLRFPDKKLLIFKPIEIIEENAEDIEIPIGKMWLEGYKSTNPTVRLFINKFSVTPNFTVRRDYRDRGLFMAYLDVKNEKAKAIIECYNNYSLNNKALLITFEKEKEEVKEGEEPSIEEAFAGFETPITTSVPTKEEKTEVEEELDLEKLALKAGFLKVKAVVFDLPTEYRGVKSKWTKNKQGLAIEERQYTLTPEEISKYRTLRKKFYNTLHKLSWKALIGWICYRNADLTPLDKVMEEFDKLSGIRREIYVVDVWLPKETIVKWLAKYIEEVKASFKDVKKRLEEEKLKYSELKALRKRFNDLRDELSRLLKEFNTLTKI